MVPRSQWPSVSGTGLDFLKVLEFFIKKEHYNNVDKIIQIKSNMNNNRTSFNWDHLQNFYIIED